MKSYCVKCCTKADYTDKPKLDKTKNNKYMLVSRYAVCKTKSQHLWVKKFAKWYWTTFNGRD